MAIKKYVKRILRNMYLQNVFNPEKKRNDQTGTALKCRIEF